MCIGSFASVAVLKVAVDDAAVLIQKFYRNAALRRGGRHSETRFHVLNDLESDAANRLDFFCGCFSDRCFCGFR